MITQQPLTVLFMEITDNTLFIIDDAVVSVKIYFRKYECKQYF